MARSLNGSTQCLSVSSAILTGTPLTMAAWCFATSLNTGNLVLSLGDTVSQNLFILYAATRGIVVFCGSSGTFTSATSSASPTTNTWFHAAGVFTSPTLRAAYFNGGNKGTDTTSNTPGALNRTSIGASFKGSTSPADFFAGSIAEACIWNVALTDSEVAALAKGVRPSRMRPLSIVGYWPLWGLASPETDLSGAANNMVLTAAPPAANHAPVTLFTRKSPALAYPSYLPPANYGIAPLGQAAILHGGRM